MASNLTVGLDDGQNARHTSKAHGQDSYLASFLSFFIAHGFHYAPEPELEVLCALHYTQLECGPMACTFFSGARGNGPLVNYASGSPTVP